MFVRSKVPRWNDHLTKTDELRYDSLHMEAICLSRGSSTRSMLHCSSKRIEPSMTRRDRQSIEKEESIRHVGDREAGVEGGAATLRTHNRDRASV